MSPDEFTTLGNFLILRHAKLDSGHNSFVSLWRPIGRLIFSEGAVAENSSMFADIILRTPFGHSCSPTSGEIPCALYCWFNTGYMFLRWSVAAPTRFGTYYPSLSYVWGDDKIKIISVSGIGIRVGHTSHEVRTPWTSDPTPMTYVS